MSIEKYHNLCERIANRRQIPGRMTNCADALYLQLMQLSDRNANVRVEDSILLEDIEHDDVAGLMLLDADLARR